MNDEQPVVPQTMTLPVRGDRIAEKNEAEERELPRGAALFSSGVALVLYALLRGPLRWWDLEGFIIVPSAAIFLAAALPLIIAGLVRYLRTGNRPFTGEPPIDLRPFAALLPLIALSDWLSLKYSLFQGPSIRGELSVAAIIAAGTLLALRSIWPLVIGWAMIAPVLLLMTFFGGAAGRLLFSDDHASMLYRLAVLTESFPRVPSYNVLWNAGLDARDFFATGIINLFLLIRPFISSETLVDRYTAIIAFMLFAVMPLTTYLAARISGLTPRAAAVGSLLALAATLLWYRWALKYGAMGFITSTILLPLAVALFHRALDERRRPGYPILIAMVAVTSLVVCWSMMGVVLLPLAAVGVWQLRNVSHRGRLYGAAAMLLAVNLPWMILFINVSQVGRFMTLSAPGYEEQAKAADDHAAGHSHTISASAVRPGSALSLAALQKSVRSAAVSANPLLLALGLPGIFLFATPFLRRSFLILITWLVFLGVIAAPFKPQLELDRMLVIALVLLCVPSAAAIEHLFDRVRGSLSAALACCIAAFLVVGVGAAGAAARNRTLEAFTFAEPDVKGIAAAIGQFGGQGRVLFTGFVLHELSGGHVAPLAYMSRHPLIASSPVHNLWWYTDVIPPGFRARGDAGIEEYFDLMNVSAVLAHEPTWKRFFDGRPDRYRSVYKGRRFNMYRRLRPAPGYVLEGDGDVTAQSTSGFDFIPNTADAVLRFTYLPFLEVLGCEKIEPAPMSDGVTLVRLRGCTPGQKARVQAVSPLVRMTGTW